MPKLRECTVRVSGRRFEKWGCERQSRRCSLHFVKLKPPELETETKFLTKRCMGQKLKISPFPFR